MELEKLSVIFFKIYQYYNVSGLAKSGSYFFLMTYPINKLMYHFKYYF